jgi:cyclic pyranopterin phosphate synthase
MNTIRRPGDRKPGSGLTHVDEHGKAHMVDVTAKPPTLRVAEARCSVRTTADAAALLAEPCEGAELLETARFAGIMAAKGTAVHIPLCHPIRLDGIDVEVRSSDSGFEVTAVATITDRTGVEMEALTACAVAGLVLVGAVKELDPLTSIEALTLWHKSGGRSGTWQRSNGGIAVTGPEDPTVVPRPSPVDEEKAGDQNRGEIAGASVARNRLGSSER